MTSQTARAAQAYRRQADQGLVELCTPAHMLTLMLLECGKLGIESRADVVQHLNRAIAVPFTQAGLDQFGVKRVAQKIDAAATALLGALAPDDPRHGLYCCVMFVLKLVDEGHFKDPQNQAVLVSMLLLEDVRDARKDVDGQGVVWRLEEQKWQDEAGKMLNRAILMDPYAREPMQLAALPIEPIYLPSCYPLDGRKRRQNGHSLTAANWELPP